MRLQFVAHAKSLAYIDLLVKTAMESLSVSRCRFGQVQHQLLPLATVSTPLRPYTTALSYGDDGVVIILGECGDVESAAFGQQKLCSSKKAKHIRRRRPYYTAKMNKFDHVQAPLASFYFCNEGLRALEPVCDLLLRQVCRDADASEHLDEPPVVIIIDAFRQVHIPFDPMCRNR